MVEMPTLLSFFRQLNAYVYISIGQQNYNINYKKIMALPLI
jgi:hypothetical protein